MRRGLRHRAERRKPMPPEAEAEVREELARLRARTTEVTAVVAASVDGLVLAADPPLQDAESIAALTAAALGVGLRLADTTGRGGFRELLVRGDEGYVATYAAGSACVLTVLAGPRVNVGRLHMEARRSGARVADLIHSAAVGPEDP
ncbi:roadblock/LC7 domain-containing protein [Streptomyces sp. V4-01]|uniref:Roadblock/LC7 domain-containing protein n=1 Tax=Actinacidiphila polyblastidii TaxID=3110430 RepID=A0ABU7PH49_9ACTN|nr:roadblock/LC7 domain-containing protein [Streptomyces sp. V4-01]